MYIYIYRYMYMYMYMYMLTYSLVQLTDLPTQGNAREPEMHNTKRNQDGC